MRMRNVLMDSERWAADATMPRLARIFSLFTFLERGSRLNIVTAETLQCPRIMQTPIASRKALNDS